MDDFVVVVDGVVRFQGTFEEAAREAATLRQGGASPVVRRAQPDDELRDEHERGRPLWDDDDDDVIPF